MPEPVCFDYAILRVVPNVAREEFINVGVVLYASTERYLDARIDSALSRLALFAPDADVPFIRNHLEVIPRICQGGENAGPIGALTQKERWHWLVAPRSTVIQVSPVHSGISPGPLAEALDRIFKAMVLPAKPS